MALRPVRGRGNSLPENAADDERQVWTDLLS